MITEKPLLKHNTFSFIKRFFLSQEKLYSWEGIDQDGSKKKGLTEAHSKKQLKHLLKEKNIITLKIKRRANPFWAKKVSKKQLCFFTAELLNLLKTGIPINQSLEIIYKSQRSFSFRRLIECIKLSIENGESLSNTLKKFPDYFDVLYGSIIEAGELSGKLEESLAHLSRHQKRIVELKRRVKKALIYPVTVLCVAILITLALLIFVVPHFESIFANVNSELPTLTRSIIWLSYVVRHDMGKIAVWIFLIVMMIWLAKQYSKRFSHFLEMLPFYIPIIRKIFRLNAFANWHQSFASTVSAGLPLLEALKISEKTISNKKYQLKLEKVRAEVANGKSLHQALTETEFFPESTIQLITISEQNGKLEETLISIANEYERHLDDAAKQFSSLVEPVITIFIAIIAGVLIIAMYLPIFQIGNVL